jgi:hypothetical protein
MPPPAHSVPTPTPPPRRRNSWISVTRIRAPDAAMGCPIPTAPPFTLTMSWGKPSLREQATAMVANASLISTRATSDSLSPARANARGRQTVGARPVRAGSIPHEFHDRTVARGSKP